MFILQNMIQGTSKASAAGVSSGSPAPVADNQKDKGSSTNNSEHHNTKQDPANAESPSPVAMTNAKSNNDTTPTESNARENQEGISASVSSQNGAGVSVATSEQQMQQQQQLASNAYNDFARQAAAAAAGSNIASAAAVPDATNAPLITTLLLSVANQQPALVPQVQAMAPTPPQAQPTSAATGAPPSIAPKPTAAPALAPAAAFLQASALPPQSVVVAAAPMIPQQAGMIQMPNMGFPFHPGPAAANMFPFSFLIPQQMAMLAQQQQQQQQFVFAPTEAGSMPGSLQLPAVPTGVAGIPFNIMAAVQQQQQQHLQQQHFQQQQYLLGANGARMASRPVSEENDEVENKVRTVPLYLNYDERALTEYQCLLRQQIELFEATEVDYKGNAQGRHTRIKPGQVGIRCRHCSNLPRPSRARGSMYYSKTIDGMYQVAQNMSKLHLCKNCHKVPAHIKQKLFELQKNHTRASGGKEYWAEGLRVLGVVELDGVLKFKPRVTPAAMQQAQPVTLPA